MESTRGNHIKVKDKPLVLISGIKNGIKGQLLINLNLTAAPTTEYQLSILCPPPKSNKNQHFLKNENTQY